MIPGLTRIHHVAVIASDYDASRHFYTEIIGLTLLKEVYRADRDSYKADLSLNNEYIIELFSFPDSPSRLSYPEATGLRHLAFEVADINRAVQYLHTKGITAEPIRVDEVTYKKFTFIADPDDLPIEFYEK